MPRKTDTREIYCYCRTGIPEITFLAGAGVRDEDLLFFFHYYDYF